MSRQESRDTNGANPKQGTRRDKAERGQPKNHGTNSGTEFRGEGGEWERHLLTREVMRASPPNFARHRRDRERKEQKKKEGRYAADLVVSTGGRECAWKLARVG